MTNRVNIAVDAMGGENSPKKIVDGIELSLKESKDNFFKLYGNKDQLNTLVNEKPGINNYCEIQSTIDVARVVPVPPFSGPQKMHIFRPY